MIILVHNVKESRMEFYERALSEPMPHANETLRVGEFRGASQASLMWTTTLTMESWVGFRRLWGQGIYVPYAFKRIGEGGHAAQSQHYAGTAFDVGQNLTNAQRASMRQLAEKSGMWSYVEPAYLTPTWVHFDRRLFPPACPTGGYPLVRRGSVGVYVCILQDALNFLMGTTLAIDGIFGYNTDDAVENYQASRGLYADGVVGCVTWRSITTAINP